MKVCSILFACMCVVGASRAQVVFHYDQPWRYNADGLELGTSWREAEFDDTLWLTGAGVFASFNEPLIDAAIRNTQLATTASNRYVTNFYFRTRFLASAVPPGHVLYATNQIDDGAVIYFNGIEVGRVAMPPGNPTANTLATRSDDVSFHGLEVIRVETTNLLAANTLAAELHQGSGASGDMVWGMKLVAVPAPVQILVQPEDQSAIPGGSVTLAVTAYGGGPIYFQWLKDAVPVENATNASITLTNVQASDAGTYAVTVSNALAAVTSSNATVTVGCAAPVVIAREPISQTLPAGSTLTLDVGTSGTAPLTYQWFRNGIAVPGATFPAYTKSNLMSSDAGLYTVRVSNCAGLRESSNAVVAVVEPPAVLVAEAQLWKFNQDGIGLGTAWREPLYDDSSWPSGPGIFGFPTNENTLGGAVRTELIRQQPGAPTATVTYYFRTQFEFTNEPGTVSLIFSNRIDDGVVFYLNGQEIHRIAMPSNAINELTFATRGDDISSHGIDVFTIPTDDVLPGINLLAAELHQPNYTSADAIFGTIVSAQVPPVSLLVVTNQPLDLIVEESKTATFAAGISGSGARFQWFKDGVPIPGATRSLLVISNVTLEDAGSYSLRASNALNVVFTRLARLGVVIDTTPPKIVGDILDDSTVLLSFSERITPSSATNRQNYSITNTLGGTATIISLSLTNATNVLLETLPLAPDRNYVARLNGLADVSPRGNLVASNTLVPLARTVTLTAFDAVWDFYDPFPLFGENPDPGTNWNALEFTLSETWGAGAGAFFFSPEEAPLPVNTVLSQTDTLTSYFRNRFTSQAGRGGLRLNLRHAVDDGAVFYLNGTEIARFNMPDGIPTFTNSSSSVISSLLVRDVPAVPPTSFRTGSNVLAVELHQAAAADVDKLFAAELVARIESFALGPIIVAGGPDDRTVIEGDPVEFAASSAGAETFQWQCCTTDAFSATNLPGATNPIYRVERAARSLDGQTFRLKLSNSNSFMVTTGANLRVIPDATPPRLLAAFLSNGVVVVTFSEPVAAGTALDLSHYTVTNELGEIPTLTNVSLMNETNAVLSFAGSLTGRYTLAVRDVTDTAMVPNRIPPGSTATIGAEYFLPIGTDWKYLLINTNSEIQSNFAKVAFDDSLWPASNALLYVETGTLPGPKNTLLSLFDDTGTNRINTYYFRKSFVAPLAANFASLRIRHIIDDGLVLYLNGSEVYRYNLATGAVTAATQAPLNIGDATLLGPFEFVVTNFVAGTNVLAAEVHQNGAASSDVVFGLELRAFVASSSVTTRAQPHLTVSRWSADYAIEWGSGTLECAESVTGPWRDVTSASPHFVSPTNAAAFYRVRR